ncbi:ASB_HP2_G0000960.mRNA.1.CDS.1 [Saccharomyces cerevisiae]|nr:ASB_HP2_G0000960.mRNA.1.CDS.1 [Saccharomyces cerevisiae]CAI6381979.1 ASB_HP2_G0000960.mRNA.1.CDS.1 [Saccharomyces cerevisiae]
MLFQEVHKHACQWARGKNGMNVNFYKYSLLDSTTYSYPQYMTSGYASNWN